MKNFIKILLAVLVALSFTQTAFAQTILFPARGGTGIGTAIGSDVGSCIKVLDDSPLTYEFGTCGSGGGGSGGGTWSTTTSQVSGRLINYPNNSASDIVAIGSNSTTTAEYWFDPNTSTSYISGTLTFGSASGTSATTTNLNIGSIISRILLTDAQGDVSGYAGTTCTNQFVRVLNALGAATCATVDISADTNLTADGTEIVLTGDALSLGSSVARDTELPVGANPSSSVGTAQVNGSASTFMRSDGAPAIDLTMAPTWQGLHIFSTGGIISRASSTAQYFNSASSTIGLLRVTGNATTSGELYIGGGTTTASKGFNIASGCFAINNVCVAGGAGTPQTPWAQNINGATFSLSGVGSLDATSSVITQATSTDLYSLRATLATFNGTSGTTSNFFSTSVMGTNGSFTSATSSSFTATQQASTSALTVSNSVRFLAMATGVLKSTAGVISSGLVSLTSEISGILGIANGGTNTAGLGTMPLAFDGTRVIATSTPTAQYFIATSTDNASRFPFASSTAMTAVTGFFTTLGIGTSSPSFPLSVVGRAHVKTTSNTADALGVENSAGTSTFSVSTVDGVGSIFSVASSTGTVFWGIERDGRELVKVGTNQANGTSTLASGTVTVNNTLVQADSLITLTLQTCSSCGAVSIGTVTAGTSFVINSTNGADASIVYWSIKRPQY